MLPIHKVKNIVLKHDSLEKELTLGKIEPKLFALPDSFYQHTLSLA